MMHANNASASTPVVLPRTASVSAPSPSHAKLQPQTAAGEIAPDGIGRAARRWRSNSASKASFKIAPPVKSAPMPKRSSGSFPKFPPPPSHHPARQFDQTVGRFDTRPKTGSARSWRIKVWFIAPEWKQKERRLASPRFAILGRQNRAGHAAKSAFDNLQTGVDTPGVTVYFLPTMLMRICLIVAILAALGAGTLNVPQVRQKINTLISQREG